MEIKDIKQTKAHLENKIGILLNEFQRQTDCVVTGINIRVELVFGNSKPDIMVDLDVGVK